MTHKPIAKTEKMLLQLRLFFMVLRMIWKKSGTPFAFLSGVRRTYHHLRLAESYWPPAKVYRLNGLYYWHLNLPGSPSKPYKRILGNWLDEVLDPSVHNLLFAGFVVITRKCSLDCEHCFERETLNRPDRNEAALIRTIEHMIELGPGQIILTGGEPATRFPAILHILDQFHDRHVDFWIITSGMGLDRERIMQLKECGLTGIIFSLDHSEEAEHDRFRGRAGSYRQVIDMTGFAREAGLATAFSLCATNGFVSRKNLEAYMDLAARMDVMFVQLLEPKPCGRYAGRDVELDPATIKMLEAFYIQACRRRDWPVLIYPDYDRRRFGCWGGRFYLYVDADGYAFPCPFNRDTPVVLANLTPANLCEQLTCSVAG